MPAPLAGAGRLLEARVAPPFYRRTRTVTPSEATREELLAARVPPELVTAVDNGTDPYFSPGGERWPDPTVVAVGPPGAGQALRAAARVGRARPAATVPDAAPADHRRRPAARPSWRRGSEPTTPSGWATLLGHVTTWPAARRVPPGVGRRQRLARRGVGAVADRGRGVRHARPWRPTSAATAARSSTARPACWPPSAELGDALAARAQRRRPARERARRRRARPGPHADVGGQRPRRPRRPPPGRRRAARR